LHPVRDALLGRKEIDQQIMHSQNFIKNIQVDEKRPLHFIEYALIEENRPLNPVLYALLGRKEIYQQIKNSLNFVK
jgi:hypothetical protein